MGYFKKEIVKNLSVPKWLEDDRDKRENEERERGLKWKTKVKYYH